MKSETIGGLIMVSLFFYWVLTVVFGQPDQWIQVLAMALFAVGLYLL